MAGHGEEVQVAAVDFQGEEDVDPFAGDRAVDVEEVHGEHGRGLRPEELLPGRVGGAQRCWRCPVPREDPADGRRANTMAELAQLALDGPGAPGRVLAGQPLDQFGDDVIEGWATGAVRVGPLRGHQAAVPPQDGRRSDQTLAA